MGVGLQSPEEVSFACAVNFPNSCRVRRRCCDLHLGSSPTADSETHDSVSARRYTTVLPYLLPFAYEKPSTELDLVRAGGAGGMVMSNVN